MTTATPKRDALKRMIGDLKSQSGGVDFDETTGELWLSGDIGTESGEVSAREVRLALEKIGPRKAVIVYIHSPGGSVSEGLAIYELLAKHPGGVTTVASLAASMGSLIFQVGQRRIVEASGMLMVHLPWVRMSGNSLELAKQSEIMTKFESQMISVYVEKTGLPAEEIKRMLENETWFTADEAVTAGFADSVYGKEFPRRAAAAAAIEKLAPRTFSLRNHAKSESVKIAARLALADV